MGVIIVRIAGGSENDRAGILTQGLRFKSPLSHRATRPGADQEPNHVVQGTLGPLLRCEDLE